MATHDYVIANQSGAAFRTDLNNALAAIQSNNSNGSSPSDTVAYQWWADTSAGILKIRNSSNNAWVELLQLDGTLTFEDGSVSTPAIAARSDLDTGIFRSGDNLLNFATGGVERLEIGAETIFNESGADVDFRIESDTKAHMFYVDAGNNRIGINTSGPTCIFEIVDTGTSGDGIVEILKLNGAGNNTNDGAEIVFQRASSNTIRIQTQKVLSNNTTDLIFHTRTSNTVAETMRLTGTGKLGVGYSDPQANVHISNSFGSPTGGIDSNVALLLSHSSAGNSLGFAMLAATNGVCFMHFGDTSNSDQGAIVYNNNDDSLSFNANATTRLTISSTGNIGAPSGTNIYNASDSRLKKNVVELSKGLDVIKSLRPISFNWIDGFCDEEKETLYGFIAQEIEKIDKNLVEKFGSGTVTIGEQVIDNVVRVKEKSIIPLLVKSIQELEAKVAVLEAA